MAHMQQQAELQRETEEQEAFLLLLAPDGGSTSPARAPVVEIDGP